VATVVKDLHLGPISSGTGLNTKLLIYVSIVKFPDASLRVLREKIICGGIFEIDTDREGNRKMGYRRKRSRHSAARR
jgi:hypothetical protein